MKSPELVRAASFVLAFGLTTTLTACEKLTPPRDCLQIQPIYRGYTPDQFIEIFLPEGEIHPETGCFRLRLLRQPSYDQTDWPAGLLRAQTQTAVIGRHPKINIRSRVGLSGEQADRFTTDSILPEIFTPANYTLEWKNWAPIKATFENRAVALIKR